MGYYTYYSLRSTNKPIPRAVKVEIVKYLNSLMEIYEEDDPYFKHILECYDPIYEFIEREDMKWYECHEHMEELGKKFPEYCFCLEGHGEERGDIWRLYVWCDKYKHCPGRIYFEDEPDWAYG